jgi:hypothetical protein
VFLYLPGETRGREIGWMSDKGKTFNSDRKPENHLHKKSQSYGFFYYFLSTCKFEKVIIHELPSGRQLTAGRIQILLYGFFLWAKKKGFEKQIFFYRSDFETAQSLEQQKEDDLYIKNYQIEPDMKCAFRMWVESVLESKQPLLIQDAIKQAVEGFDIKKNEAEEYLQELCNPSGRLRVVELEGKKYILFKRKCSRHERGEKNKKNTENNSETKE